MVLRGIEEEEENEETEPISPISKKRKPLHNFTLPILKWGTQRSLRCSNAAIYDGNGSSTSGGADRGSVQRRRVFIGFGGDDDDDEEGIAVVRKKLLHDLKIDTDRLKDTILRKGIIEEESDEERETLKSWSMRTRRKTEIKQRDSPSPAKVESTVTVAVAGGEYVSSRLRSNINVKSNNNKIERRKFSVQLLTKEIEEDFVAFMGRGPRKRPTKRPRNVQRQINNIFPGLWLREVNEEMYEVQDTNQNGKSGKRKGLRNWLDDDDDDESD
ncbi:hypothetical protein MtrunA17_Chr5g0423311 [Medicago truncatula]|uniref:DUF1639 family protein n=1 Tax=Medicago truncatula TaxID=3880 RepID=G7K0I9_MEDTR|nr:uncharacterized protein LOC11411191 [Medicago truncatula]AES97558.1 DUF1639 family protein [Medicago truncatula]RHN55886.1 hypothetical protein MtrunA17_Chr5g0423311 [Medicago truncatula]